MRYDISIRVNFPEEITSVLRAEKQRYISEYGSGYKSEPHMRYFMRDFMRDSCAIIRMAVY